MSRRPCCSGGRSANPSMSASANTSCFFKARTARPGCEDLHTSYWAEFGGGLRREGTFIEFSKGLVDALHAWHSRDCRALAVGEFTRTAWSMHYYDSVFVVEKRRRATPHQLATGKEAL